MDDEEYYIPGFTNALGSQSYPTEQPVQTASEYGPLDLGDWNISTMQNLYNNPAMSTTALNQYLADQNTAGKEVVSLNPYASNTAVGPDSINANIWNAYNQFDPSNPGATTGEVVRFNTGAGDGAYTAPVVVQPNTKYTLTDYNGNVLGTGSTAEEIQKLVSLADQNASKGWNLYQGDPVSGGQLFKHSPKDNALLYTLLAAGAAMGGGALLGVGAGGAGGAGGAAAAGGAGAGATAAGAGGALGAGLGTGAALASAVPEIVVLGNTAAGLGTLGTAALGAGALGGVGAATGAFGGGSSATGTSAGGGGGGASPQDIVVTGNRAGAGLGATGNSVLGGSVLTNALAAANAAPGTTSYADRAFDQPAGDASPTDIVVNGASGGLTLPEVAAGTAALGGAGALAASGGAGAPTDTSNLEKDFDETFKKNTTLNDIIKYLRLAGLGVSTIGSLFGGKGGNSGLSTGGLSGMRGDLNPIFGAKLPTGSSLAVPTAGTRRPMNNIDWYRYGYGPEQSFFSNIAQSAPNTSRAYTGYAEGGYAVGGAGDGRDDKIPALLSDGEYVMDAETVSMLGNGSNKAGAEALDKFRVNVRKHKGQKLAKGEFSVDAKKPEKYLKGRK